jgi:hypothetical protein
VGLKLRVDPVTQSNPELELPCCKLTQLQHLSLRGISPQLHTGQAFVTTRSSRSKAHCLSYPAAAVSHAAAAAGAATGLLPQLQHLSLDSCAVQQQHFMQLTQLTRLSSFEYRNVRLVGRLRTTYISYLNQHRNVGFVLQHLTQLTTRCPLLLSAALTVCPSQYQCRRWLPSATCRACSL